MAFAVGFALCGCKRPGDGSEAEGNRTKIVAPARPDALETWDAAAPSPAYLANGLIGVRIARDGSGTGHDGKPLASFSPLAYNLSGEEKILPLPTPLIQEARLDGKPILPADATNYVQSQPIVGDERLVASQWNVGSSLVKTTTSLDPMNGVVHQTFTLNNAVARVISFKIGPPKNSTDGAPQPRVEDGSARIQWSGEDESLEISLFGIEEAKTRLEAGLVWFECKISESAFTLEITRSFSALRGTQGRMNQEPADILIDGPVEDQQAIRSFLYYLRSSIPQNRDSAVSPMGLSSATYGGHVFWDADIWVFPALALLDPDRAKTIANYRIRQSGAAARNFREQRSWARIETIPKGPAETDVLQFPWESSQSGLEVSPTETKQQHHITGDVAWMLDLASSLGICDPNAVSRVGKQAANFYLWRAEPEPAPSVKEEPLFTIKNTISPDEFHFGDDDLYTNCLAEAVIRRFQPDFAHVEFVRPKDTQGFLNYQGDRLKGYKQAAGLLAIYPLQDPQVEAEAATMLKRFGGKSTKSGPAMSDSVEALIAARWGEPDAAYESWRKSWKDFANRPLLLFSEKRSKDASYFVTGAAGSLQTVIYGFCGIRIDSKPQAGSVWQLGLNNGKVLSLKPHLPGAWKSVRIRGLTVLGKRYNLKISHKSVTLE